MRTHPGWLVGWTFWFLAAPFAGGNAPPAPRPGADRDVMALAAKIDQYFAASWAAAKVQPAPLAADAEFLRVEVTPLLSSLRTPRSAFRARCGGVNPYRP